MAVNVFVCLKSFIMEGRDKDLDFNETLIMMLYLLEQKYGNIFSLIRYCLMKS